MNRKTRSRNNLGPMTLNKLTHICLLGLATIGCGASEDDKGLAPERLASEPVGVFARAADGSFLIPTSEQADVRLTPNRVTLSEPGGMLQVEFLESDQIVRIADTYGDDARFVDIACEATSQHASARCEGDRVQAEFVVEGRNVAVELSRHQARFADGATTVAARFAENIAKQDGAPLFEVSEDEIYALQASADARSNIHELLCKSVPCAPGADGDRWCQRATCSLCDDDWRCEKF